MDCYAVLELTPAATIAEIRSSYHKLALKYHPDKCDNNDAVGKFDEIKRAYEILNDEIMKYIFDSMDGYKSCEEYEKLEGMAKELITQRIIQCIKCPTVNYTVQITLAELYHGTTKTVEVELSTVVDDDVILKKVKTFDVIVPAGCESDIVSKRIGEGNQMPGKRNGDLVFGLQIVDADTTWHLEDRDVHVEVKVPVEKLICGTVLNMQLFSDENIKVNANNINPKDRYVLANYGMRDESGNRGDLIIHFNIVYTEFDSQTKEKLADVFGLTICVDQGLELQKLDAIHDDECATEAPDCGIQ